MTQKLQIVVRLIQVEVKTIRLRQLVDLKVAEVSRNLVRGRHGCLGSSYLYSGNHQNCELSTTAGGISGVGNLYSQLFPDGTPDVGVMIGTGSRGRSESG